MDKREFEIQLREKIIPYWEEMCDRENGGYYGLKDFDLHIDRKAVKGGILNSRILWFFAEAYRLLHEEELLFYADHAYAFLTRRLIDPDAGGVFWSVNFDGTPDDTAKHTYNQAFAIYALAAYYRASGSREALDTAEKLHAVIEEKCKDASGYRESFDRYWKQSGNEKLSEDGYMASRTMNTVLHVMEAYTGLCEASPSAKCRRDLMDTADMFSRQIYNPAEKHLEVFFDQKMKSISDLYSYGHDIEASWLLDRATDTVGDAEFTGKIHRITDILAEGVLENGFDGNSVNNECLKGTVDQTKVWWVQAEAVVGFTNAYFKTGDIRYRTAADRIWDYIKMHFIDPRQGGEWFWDLSPEGTPDSRKPITEPWKCPYHNGRMCMEMIRRLEKAAEE